MDGPDDAQESGNVHHLRNYELGKILGRGSFAVVRIANHALTGHKVAIKILNRQNIKNMGMEERVGKEITIMRMLAHPHIIRLYEVIETPTDIYVVMQYAEKGELFDYVAERKRLKEDEARNFFQQIISGVEYCHRNKVVHRDLKLENMLLDSKRNIKIADFGFGDFMLDGHFLKRSCGSPNYAAPEVISGKSYVGPEIDVWSCGIILYALVCGTLPFEDENFTSLFKKIKGGVYTPPSQLSDGARDLISRILVVDPVKRMTLPEIRMHPWFSGHLPPCLPVRPTDIVQQAIKIDENVLLEMVKWGFDRSDRLINDICSRVENQGTVTYYLLLDNRSVDSNDCLGTESLKPMEINSNQMQLNGALSASVGQHIQGIQNCLQNGSRQFPFDRNWVLELQFRAHPHELVTEVLNALQELNVGWEKIGPGNMKCRWSSGISISVLCNHYFGDGSSVIKNDLARLPNEVEFTMQFRKTDEKYLLDLQWIQGSLLLFRDLCATFWGRFQVP